MDTRTYTVEHFPNAIGLKDGAENIGGDANPAAVIFEILTTPVTENGTTYGCGVPVEHVAVDTFRDVGEQLAREGRGLSLVLGLSVALDDPPAPLVFVRELVERFGLTLAADGRGPRTGRRDNLTLTIDAGGVDSAQRFSAITPGGP